MVQGDQLEGRIGTVGNGEMVVEVGVENVGCGYVLGRCHLRRAHNATSLPAAMGNG